MQNIILKALEVLAILYLIKLGYKDSGNKEKALSIFLLLLIAIDLFLYFIK